MSITHWRLYLACRVAEFDLSYVEIDDSEAGKLKKLFETPRSRDDRPRVHMVAVALGREPNRNPRTLYVNLDQIVAIEPIEESDATT
jgi:hypothetical protein